MLGALGVFSGGGHSRDTGARRMVDLKSSDLARGGGELKALNPNYSPKFRSETSSNNLQLGAQGYV